MEYKFKVGDPVIFREDPKNKNPFNPEREPLYILYAYVEENPRLNEYDKRVLRRNRIIYQISCVSTDCGSGYLSSIENVREDQLTLYEGNDEDIMDYFKDVKKELEERLREGTLRKLEYHGWFAYRTPTYVDLLKIKLTPEEKEAIKVPDPKFSIGDVVTLKKESKEESRQGKDHEPIYMIYNYTENNKNLSSLGRTILRWQKDWRYEICEIKEGEPFGDFEKLRYVSEAQIERYSGKSEKAFALIQKAGEELKRRMEKHTLYRRNSMKL